MADDEKIVAGLIKLQTTLNEKSNGAGDIVVDKLGGDGTSAALDVIKAIDTMTAGTQPQ